MTFIDDKINALNETDRRNYEETLRAILSDDPSKVGSWLNLRGFNENYSLNMVKITLYREMYKGDFSRLEGE